MANASHATPIESPAAGTRPGATIIIPAWNAWEHTERCLRSLERTLGPTDQVVVVDNGSRDGTRARLAAHSWLDVITNEQNVGFARACNQGAASARRPILVFLNSDTIVPPGWLDELLAAFDDESVAAAGPRSDNVSGRQAVMAVPDPWEDADAFLRFATAWREAHVGQRSEARRLIGFCLAVRTSTFRALDGFDERFETGGFEDDDLCRRILQGGHKLLIAHGSFVHHHGHASFDANDVDWQVTQHENRARFEDKWGADALRRRVLLSACLIVKDEEQMLAACLDSVRDTADEVVVYDTGSSDRTVQIAREAGATVIEGVWEDSFAGARNAALAHATGEWVLSIDADERLQADPDFLRGQLSDLQSDTEAFLVAIENLHGPGNPRSVHTAIRVFRRRSAVWRHRLHEQVTAADDPSRRLCTAYLAGARLIHHGYVAEVFDDRRKAERNLELAWAALEDGEVGRPYALMNLGRALESAGRSEEAVRCLSDAVASDPDIITRRLAVTNLVYILGRIGRFDEALTRVGELRQLSRSQVAADIAEGRTRLAMGETAEGLAILARVPSRARDDDGMEYGPHVVAAIRGEALASLGRYGEAADVVLAAVRSEGVLEADIGELVRWLLHAERSPAEITAALSAEDLVAMLGRVLRQPPPLADVLLDGAWERFPDRLEPLAAAASVAPHLPLARALVWSARLRRRGLAASCPLVTIGTDTRVDPVIRIRAAAALHGSFGDGRAVAMARTALAELDPTARTTSREEIVRLAPSLQAALASGLRESAPSTHARVQEGQLASAPVPTPAPRTTHSRLPRQRATDRVLRVTATTERGGVNIVGPFEGTSVEADVARRLTVALRGAGVPTSTISYHRDERDRASTWSHRGASGFPYDVNLLVVHPEQMTDFVLDAGPGLFRDRYVIGLWVWDVQSPSPAMADAARMVHEVWTPTTWGAAAASAVFDGPVHALPIPVGRRPSGPSRGVSGPPGRMVFTCCLDYESGFERQNPIGAVAAYSSAFSPDDHHRLVIDTVHADRYPEEHGMLMAAADGRPDIVLRLLDPWSGEEGDRLLSAADCHLSLHRADGGLGAVAKAMSWGTLNVVAATPSLEFLGPDEGFLVPAAPVAVGACEYRYPSDAVWHEPDLEHARSMLQAMAADPDGTATKVLRARRAAAHTFSRSKAAAMVRARLTAIAQQRYGRGQKAGLVNASAAPRVARA